jgi:hypothetical protein
MNAAPQSAVQFYATDSYNAVVILNALSVCLARRSALASLNVCVPFAGIRKAGW